MSTHDGHRQRMKNAFAEHGLESFDDVHALNSCCSTSVRAATPIDRPRAAGPFRFRWTPFSRASVEELSNVDGVGDEASFLRLIPGGQPALYDEPAQDDNDKRHAGRLRVFPAAVHVCPHGARLLSCCWTIWLRVLSCRELGQGQPGFCEHERAQRGGNGGELPREPCDPRRIITPGGGITPSPDDYVSTEMLEKALGGFGVQLLDHIIVSGVQAGSIFKANRDYRQIV